MALSTLFSILLWVSIARIFQIYEHCFKHYYQYKNVQISKYYGKSKNSKVSKYILLQGTESQDVCVCVCVCFLNDVMYFYLRAVGMVKDLKLLLCNISQLLYIAIPPCTYFLKLLRPLHCCTVCLFCIVLYILCKHTESHLPRQIPCLCKLTWPIKPDSDNIY